MSLVATGCYLNSREFGSLSETATREYGHIDHRHDIWCYLTVEPYKSALRVGKPSPESPLYNV